MSWSSPPPFTYTTVKLLVSYHLILFWSLSLSPSWLACLQTVIYCVHGRAFLIADYFGTNCKSHTTPHLKSGGVARVVRIVSARCCSVPSQSCWMKGSLLFTRSTICKQFSSYLCEVLPTTHCHSLKKVLPSVSGIISLQSLDSWRKLAQHASSCTNLTHIN